jgi:hypothetical protein
MEAARGGCVLTAVKVIQGFSPVRIQVLFDTVGNVMGSVDPPLVVPSSPAGFNTSIAPDGTLKAR